MWHTTTNLGLSPVNLTVLSGTLNAVLSLTLLSTNIKESSKTCQILMRENAFMSIEILFDPITPNIYHMEFFYYFYILLFLIGN